MDARTIRNVRNQCSCRQLPCRPEQKKHIRKLRLSLRRQARLYDPLLPGFLGLTRRSTPASTRAILHCLFLRDQLHQSLPAFFLHKHFSRTAVYFGFAFILPCIGWSPEPPVPTFANRSKIFLSLPQVRGFVFRSHRTAVVSFRAGSTCNPLRLGSSFSCLVRDVTYVSGQKAEAFL